MLDISYNLWYGTCIAANMALKPLQRLFIIDVMVLL